MRFHKIIFLILICIYTIEYSSAQIYEKKGEDELIERSELLVQSFLESIRLSAYNYYNANGNYSDSIFINKQKIYITNLFTKDAIIYTQCGPSDGLSVGSASKPANFFANIVSIRDDWSRVLYNSNDLDICFVKKKNNLISVKFKSNYESVFNNKGVEKEYGGCQPSLEEHLAYIKYTDIDEKYYALKISAIGYLRFSSSNYPCYPREYPKVSFVQPLKDTTNKEKINVVATIRKADKEKIDIRINNTVLPRKHYKKFLDKGETIKFITSLRIGKNLIEINASNRFGTTTQRKEIYYKDKKIRTSSTQKIIQSPFITRLYPKNRTFSGTETYLIAHIANLEKEDEIELTYNRKKQKNGSDYTFDYNTNILDYKIPIESIYKKENLTIKIIARKRQDINKFDTKEENLIYEPKELILNNDNEELNDELEKIKIKLDTSENRRKRLFNSLKSLNRKHQDSLRQLKNLRNKVLSFTEIKARLDSTYREEIDRLNRRIAELERIIRMAKKRDRDSINTLNTTIRIMKKEYKKYAGYDNDRALFIGLNYQLISSPYQSFNSSRDPIWQSFNDFSVSKLGLSVYYQIGFFFENYKKSKIDVPNVSYPMSTIVAHREQLALTNTRFKDLEFIGTSGNIKTFNAGLNLYTHIKPFYLKLGASVINGSVWDNYEGDFQGLPKAENGYYSIGYRDVNSTGLIIGLAYARPAFQVELGYNQLYEDFFLNMGLNIPIRNINIKGFRLNWKYRNGNKEASKKYIEGLFKD